jgi:hypothetical protein
MVPTEGADGIGGCSLITACTDGAETHENEFITVKV